MNKNWFFAAALLLTSGVAMAGVDHYLLRDGTHVHHLKVSKLGNDLYVSTDVDFEPNAAEAGKHACTAQVSGEAKKVSDSELVLKKHIEGEARACVIKVNLTANGAKIDQNEDCNYFAAGICHFDSDGKELPKIQ
jgi:hypothetical protein